MGIRKKVSVALGCAQGTIGAFAAVFAYVLYHNFLNTQVILNVPSQDVGSYMMALIVFGVLSVISGLFLVTCNE